MRIVSTNFIPDRSRPGLTTTAIGAVDLQGAGGNWATVGRRSRGGRRVHRQREKRKGKSVGLRIGTLNVGTMTGKGRELADVMERRKVDILCVQETRWKGSKARSIGAGFKLFYNGVDSKRNGVGVVLKEEFVRNVLEVKRVSDRVMSLKLEIEGVMLNVVSGYAPQVGCELEEKERFWSELDEVMESIPTGERVVIGADFNGHVGEGNTGDEEVMGKFGVKERNLEGQMVVDFAKRMDMAVVNTYFQKREEHRVTYKSGGRRTQVDYILCRRGNLKEISDCKVVVGESVARQHRMVVCRMTLMVCKTKRSKIEMEKKTKWWKLKKEECCEEFREKLRQALGGQVVLPDDWETTAEVIRETGRKVLGVSSGRRKEDKETWWWNEEVQDSIQRKRLAKKKWDMDRTEENRQEYKELQRRVKREVSKAKQKAYDELYTRLDTREGEKDLYRLARQRDRDGKDVQQVRVIKDRDGRVLTSEESVQRRWKEYFGELMNEENEREKRVEGVNSVEQEVDKIRKDEVRKALKRMKSGKAVGPDDIPVEVWKCLGEAAVEFLASLFNRVLESEKMPEEWRRSVLVPIFKNKGDVQSCSNYRGIKLMSHTMKVWERVVEARLRKVVEICEQQYGFMPRKSTTDAIFALRILMEKYRDGQRELHCVFVDLEKAYDRVPREELWYCMRKSGVAEKYVRVVQDMYERSRTVVRCAVGQTEEFKVEVGLHQGSALSPFLFAIVMDQLSEEVRQESPWTMMFADDIVICSESREQVEENLERWRFALERRGMKVSRSKTEYMCVNEREGNGTVRLQGEEVKKVQEFKYLGSTVQSNGECGKEVKKRVQAGWNGWRKVSGVLCDRKISARIKGKVYRTVVRPAMLYGLETVSLRKRQESELEVAELKMLRFSLGVTRLDRIRNEYIRGTAHVGRLGDKVREARLRWFGHVQRRETQRMDPATSASGGQPLQITSPITDPAELRNIIVRQGAIIRSYQDQVTALQAQLSGASIAAPIDPPSARGESPRLALPEKFDGSADRCRGFLRQCEVFFSHQPGMYREEGTKCAFLLSLMTDRALEWASAIWDADSQVKLSFAYFAGMIREVFEYPAGGKDISLQLMELRQGSETAADYAIRFRTLAAQSGWNDAALWAVFRAGLNPGLQAELACHTEATSLSQFVATSIRLDNLRRQHRTGTQASASARPRVRTDYPEHREEAPEPMQLGRSRLAAQGHRPRGQMRLCYNCGASGHLSSRCPERPSSAQVGGSSLFFSLTVPVSLRCSDRWFSVTALIDSGAAVNLIDRALVEELGIPTFPCVPSLRITAIDSQPIGEGYLTRQTELLDFRVGLFHHEQLAFYVTASPANPVILGFPWLRHHDPQISWRSGELARWSPACLKGCLRDPVPRPCGTSRVDEMTSAAHGHLPHQYTDFMEVFSEERAARLPTHQVWDCAIDLLPNTSLPKGRVYPLSLPESKAMEEYIETALDAGHIRPSTSPAAAGFFFVGKRDGGLRPCIDYRGLNAITVRYPYPLPLVPTALEQLRGARVFTKLDLRSAYNLVRIREGDEWKTAFHTTSGHYEYCVMPFGLTNAPAVFQALINGVFQDLLGKGVIAYIDDILVYSSSMEEHVRMVREVLGRLQQHHLYAKLEKCEFHRSTVTFLGYVISRHGVEMDVVKVQAVTEWPAPTSVRELQRFLGFANFYWRFIRNYSSVAGPLTSLLRGKPKKLTWTDPARSAFQQLKNCFTTAPILRHPDPDLPFVVEVDASSSGLGAVLSQRHGKPGKLHPCAFYSRKLTSAEVNYDVGNRKLLAIKAALEEWRHWLEGARHPFQVLTDHRKLEYLRGAKRLNPRQARWAIFFTHFAFTVTYRPGSKNGKADALSRQFEADDEPTQPDVILPATAILAPVQWNLIEEIRRAHTDEPPPCRLSTYQTLCAPTLPTAGYAVGARGPQLRTPRHSPIYPTRPQPVLVVLPGLGGGGVCQVVPHVRTGVDQSFTSGGAAGTPSDPSTALVAPVGGLPDRPARLRRFHDCDGGGRLFLEGV
ncbi:hypothetical protein QTP70_002182 [Hemibagrus guttatus]|uniref:ribonuclease H n=1 Tax=Hemibagrus guttatus TaxID=175788 RepID=A0AAE0PQJ4_9TELE|nr:hypothetical protein QTP70_002182 [Hemibagrus guttatus]